MSTIKRMQNDEGVWVDRVTGSPGQPVIDYPALCDNCGQTSTKESPVCECVPLPRAGGPA